MNVLVYDGPGVSKTSLSFTLSTLRTLVLPNYTVQTISPKSLTHDPWRSNCALLVIPGGRDVPYLQALEKANAGIVEYVKSGGAYLGLCAGAYYACRRVEWEVGTEKEVSGPRPLGFFRNTSKGCVYPGFEYESEEGARAVRLSVVSLETGKEEEVEGMYYNGGGEFVGARKTEGVRVLAMYDSDAGEEKTAAVVCEVEKGVAVLWATHPEYPLTLEPALSAIAKTRPDLQPRTRIAQLEEKRWDVMRDTLRTLRLQLPGAVSVQTARPTAQLLTSTKAQAQAGTIATMLERLTSDLLADAEPITLKDVADTFHFHFHRSIPARTVDDAVTSSAEPVRDLVVFRDGALPPPELTPAFSISAYYDALEEANRASKIGEVLMYGEVVTSTQTLLDKNPKLMSYLPSPLLSLATHQLAGRGRGTNTWLSPPGCLQFSLYLRLSLSSFPASKLVFIQYLFALAVAEACRDDRVLGPRFGRNVRLKWPNDIYALTSDGEGEVKKVGGILVNTSFLGGTVDVVIGHGLNVLTPSPLTSLAQLVPPGIVGTELSMERTAAVIMSHFDRLWTQFVQQRGDFGPFMDLYLSRWMHSDQLVTLTTVDPPIKARIVGITPDHGLLRTMPEYGGAFIDLQPDGNSFDLMAGLIKVKT